MATIDELSIEVQSSAKKVDGTIDKVAEQLEKLANAVSSVDVGKMHSMSTAMKKIADASIGFKGNKSNEIRSLASALKSFDKVNTNSLYSASNAVEKLADGIKGVSGVSFNADGILNVSNALSKLGGVKAVTGTENLKKVKSDLIDFSHGLNGIGAVNFDTTGLSNVISSVAKLGGKTSTNATENLPKIKKDLIGFIQGLNGLQSLKFDTTGIANLTSSISKLGGKASTNAVKTIPQLTTALHGMMTTLSRAPTVSNNVIRMTNALASLASQGGRVGSASKGIVSGFNNISKSAKRTHKGILNSITSFGRFYAVIWGVKSAFNALSGSIELASNLIEVQNVVDTTFGNMSSKVEDFAKSSIQNFGVSELATKQYASQFQAMGTAMGIDPRLIGNANKFLEQQTNGYVGMSNSMSDVSLNLTKLTADMASFYNVEQAAVAEDLQAIFTGQTRPLREYGLDLTQATLAEWAMKQGLDADIKSMSQAEKTMLRYQYVLANTLASHNDFRDTAMTWANQTRILKQQFQQLGSVIGGTFINAFKPFVATLNVVLAKVINFAETVSNALGKIFGWTIEISSGGLTNDIGEDLSDAAGGADDLADGLGGANDSAKKLQKTLSLLPFDQLNQLTGNKDTGSSGSGGTNGGTGGVGGVLDESAMANLVKTDTIFDKYKSDIDTLYELGEYIGDTLTKAMNDIDWDEVYQGARNFGKGLADFLNGLISPELFGATGRTIAGALNTALHFLDSFGEIFDFHDFGVSIATGINEFFDKFDFKLLAETLNKWVDGLEDFIAGFLKTLDKEKIKKGIGEFFDNLEVDTVGVIIGAIVIKKILGLKLGAKALDFAVGKIKEKIAEKIAPLIGGISLGNLAIKLKDFTISFAKLDPVSFSILGSKLLKAIGDAVYLLLPDWAENFIENVVAGISLGGIAGSWIPGFGTLAGAIVGGLIGALNGIEIDGKSILKTIFDKIFNFDLSLSLLEESQKFFKSAFSGDEKWYEIGKDILLGIGNGILGALAFLVEPIGDLFDWVWKGICDVFGIHSPATTMYPIGKNILLGIVEGIGESVSSIFEAGKDIVQGMFDGISEAISNIGEWLKEHIVDPFVNEFKKLFGINSPSTVMAEQGGFIIEGLLNGLKSKIGSVLDWIGKIPGWFKEKLGNAKEWLVEKGKGAMEGIKNGWEAVKESNIGQAAQKLAGYVREKAGDAKSWLSEKGKNAVEGIKNGWESVKNSELLSRIGKIGKEVSDNIGNIKSVTDLKGKDIASGLKDGFDDKWRSEKRTFEDISDKISDAIGDLYSTGKRAAQSFADGFKSVKVPVPHLYVSSWNTETSGNATYSTPNYDVSWYKTGGLFRNPSVIGVGEAGKEAVLPLENKRTMKMISEAIVGGMSLGSGESPFLENIALNTQRTEVWCERILQSAQESGMEIQRMQEKISSGAERVISEVSEIYVGIKNSFGESALAVFDKMNVPLERLISSFDYGVSIISAFLSDIRSLIEELPNRIDFFQSDSPWKLSDTKKNAFEPIKINMKNILESMQSEISDDIFKNALDGFPKNTSFDSASLTSPEEIFKQQEVHLDRKMQESSYGKQCSGIDEDMLANAVAEGVAMALMNNINNLRNTPEYIQNNIYYDGDVMARVITKAQGDRDYRFNPA